MNSVDLAVIRPQSTRDVDLHILHFQMGDMLRARGGPRNYGTGVQLIRRRSCRARGGRGIGVCNPRDVQEPGRA